MSALPHPVPEFAQERAPVCPAAFDLLARSRSSLLSACRTTDVYERYLDAHLGALRAAAALLAARSTPGGSSRPRSVWEILPKWAPELAEWAAFFAGSARQRAAIGRGAPLSSRTADDLLRQGEVFLEIVQGLLGVPLSVPLPDLIVPTTHPSVPGTSRPHPVSSQGIPVHGSAGLPDPSLAAAHER